MRSRLLVAINPSASFGRGRDAGPAVLTALRDAGHEAVGLIRPSLAELDAAVAAELAAGGWDALVVVGGDGMVHFGARHAAGTDLPLGVVPSGTGNDVARALGIPLGDPAGAVRTLLAALPHPRRIDALRVTRAEAPPAWVVGAVSAGFDALVNERANRMRRPRGASRYTLALLRELAGLRPLEYRIEVDSEARTVRAVLLAVSNGQSIGGGMRITPDALLDDGLADLLVVAPLGRLKFLALFPRVFRGRHVGLAVVQLEKVRRLRVDASVPIVAYGDGERLGPLPLEVELVPGALRVLAAPGSREPGALRPS